MKPDYDPIRVRRACPITLALGDLPHVTIRFIYLLCDFLPSLSTVSRILQYTHAAVANQEFIADSTPVSDLRPFWAPRTVHIEVLKNNCRAKQENGVISSAHCSWRREGDHAALGLTSLCLQSLNHRECEQPWASKAKRALSKSGMKIKKSITQQDWRSHREGQTNESENGT